MTDTRAEFEAAYLAHLKQQWPLNKCTPQDLVVMREGDGYGDGASASHLAGAWWGWKAASVLGGEVVAWMLSVPSESTRWFTSGRAAMEHWVSKGAISTPLYAHPAPSAPAPVSAPSDQPSNSVSDGCARIGCVQPAKLVVEPSAPGQWYVTRRHNSEPPIALFYDHQEAQRYASIFTAQDVLESEADAPIGYAKQSQIDSISERGSALLYSVACADEDWDVPVYLRAAAPAQSCSDTEQADAPQAESHVVFITDRSQSIDDVLPQDRRWVISKAIGLVAGYRNCKASETKEAMQEFVDYMRSALSGASIPRAAEQADEAVTGNGQ